MRYYDDENETPEPRLASERMGGSGERKLRHRSVKEENMDPKYRAPFPMGGPMTAMIVVGLVLFLVGLFFGYLLGVIKDPSSDLMRWFTFIAQIAWIVGTLLISGAMIFTAMRKNGISPAVRVGLIIAATVLIAIMLRSVPTLGTFMSSSGYPYYPW